MDEDARRRCLNSVQTILSNRSAYLREMQYYAAAGRYVEATQRAELVASQDQVLTGFAWALQDAFEAEGERIIAEAGGLPW